MNGGSQAQPATAAVTLCSQDGERRFKPLAEKKQRVLGREGGESGEAQLGSCWWLLDPGRCYQAEEKRHAASTLIPPCHQPPPRNLSPRKQTRGQARVSRCRGDSTARFCLLPSRCCEILTFTLPVINPSRGGSELSGSTRFPRKPGYWHYSWRSVWQNGKRAGFGKWTSSALGGTDVAWHPVGSWGLLPCAPDPITVTITTGPIVTACLPAFLLKYLYSRIRLALLYILWCHTRHKSAVLWPALH